MVKKQKFIVRAAQGGLGGWCQSSIRFKSLKAAGTCNRPIPYRDLLSSIMAAVTTICLFSPAIL